MRAITNNIARMFVIKPFKPKKINVYGTTFCELRAEAGNISGVGSKI